MIKHLPTLRTQQITAAHHNKLIADYKKLHLRWQVCKNVVAKDAMAKRLIAMWNLIGEQKEAHGLSNA